MVDDSYVSMVSEICYAMMIYGAFGKLTFLYFLSAVSKCCYQIYGVLKYIANISGLTILARYRSGALFQKVLTTSMHLDLCAVARVAKCHRSDRYIRVKC